MIEDFVWLRLEVGGGDALTKGGIYIYTHTNVARACTHTHTYIQEKQCKTIQYVSVLPSKVLCVCVRQQCFRHAPYKRPSRGFATTKDYEQIVH